MSRQNYFVCPRCGQVHDVDPKGGGESFGTVALQPSSPVADHRKVLESTALTLREILDDERGRVQPIGRLLWMVKLCVERIDLVLASSPIIAAASAVHPWTTTTDKNKCDICGDGPWGRHRFQEPR